MPTLPAKGREKEEGSGCGPDPPCRRKEAEYPRESACGFPMKGTVTATGRTFEVVVPTLRRDDAEDGSEQHCGLRKSE